MPSSLLNVVRRTAIATATAFVALGAAAQAPVIDFSSVRGAGTSQSDVLIENIRLMVPVPNPFQPGSTTTVETNYNVVFRLDPATLTLVPVGLDQTGGDGTAACASANVQVYDALRGAGAPLANVSVTLGRHTVQTNAQGVASFSGLPPSLYAVTAVAPSHVPANRTSVLTCGAPANIALALSPSSQFAGGLGAGQFRTILTWGENPRDLDSHLTGPDGTANGRWHVYFGDKQSGDMCGLDVDDTSSYGPETVTCPRTGGSASTLRPGVYRYSVRHYAGSGDIGTSNANVRLEFAGGQSYTFSPPAGAYFGSGDVWTVFEVTVGANGAASVAPVNTISNSLTAAAVRPHAGAEAAAGAQFGTAEEPSLFRGLQK